MRLYSDIDGGYRRSATDGAQDRAVPKGEVVFGVLPFSQLAPALDASTMATAAQELGLRTTVAYFNRQFAALVGPSFYDEVAAAVSLDGLLGDWVFRDGVFPPTDDLAYLSMLIARGYLTPGAIPAVKHAQAIAHGFIRASVDSIAQGHTEVVCLVDTFAKRDAVAGQLMASLAFAKELRQRRAGTTVVIASPAAEGPMGRVIADLPFVDYVCCEDASVAVPRLLQQLSAGEPDSLPVGVVRRRGETKRHKPQPPSARVLELSVPDFDDYFKLRGDGLPGSFDSLPIETSKGCWWAERSQCTFCGLMGLSVAFRSKPAPRVMWEMELLVERYGPSTIEMTDLIIDPTYFTDLFPALASRQLDLNIFYETKASIRREGLELMAAAGVGVVQAGIESLSTATLRRIGKGTSARTNLRFLKDCKEIGIRCFWNYLHSVPGETPSELLAALPTIDTARQFEPPASFGRVRVVRFSPYFATPKSFGITNLRPDRAYGFVYGGSELDLHNLAYYFEHDDSGVRADAREVAVAKLGRAVRDWQRQWAVDHPRTLA